MNRHWLAAPALLYALFSAGCADRTATRTDGSQASAVASATPFVIHPLKTPVASYGGLSYSELEDKLGWHVLRPRDGAPFENNLLQRGLTVLPRARASLLSEVYTEKGSLDEIRIRQVPDPASIGPPNASSERVDVGGFDVEIFALNSEVQARFLTGQEDSSQRKVLAVVAAPTKSVLVAFIETLE